MKIYHHPMSQNCRRVLATVYENGRDDIELVELDLMKGEHKTPEFLAINPNGKVPALVDGDFKLWESTAIMQYISGDSPLWPASKVRYDITRWQCWAIAHFGPGIDKVVYERLLKKMFGAGDPDEAVIAQGVGQFEKSAAVLDGHLEGRDWLVGDGITLADISVASCLTYAVPAGLDLQPYANIRRWNAAIEARDAWKRTAPKMG